MHSALTRKPIRERMEAFSEVDAAGCWRWVGHKTAAGYGKLKFKCETKLAHRLSYELNIGPIPDGLHLDHLCRVRDCINPAHLEPVTPAENVRRSTAWDFNKAKEACPKGHAYSPENTYFAPNGHRQCKECRRARDRVRYGA